MIRDPSDGTVRELPKVEVGIPATKATPGNIPAMPGPDTGIRQPTKTDAMERLEFSREWLKQYHAKKESADARGNDGKELQAAGHSIEGERAAKPASSA